LLKNLAIVKLAVVKLVYEWRVNVPSSHHILSILLHPLYTPLDPKMATT
jgi:hypothetical protein